MMNQDIARKYAIINALSGNGGAVNDDEMKAPHLSKSALADNTGIPETSISRILKSLKTDYGVNVLYSHVQRGFYLADWGVLNPNIFKGRYGFINRSYLQAVKKAA